MTQFLQFGDDSDGDLIVSSTQNINTNVGVTGSNSSGAASIKGRSATVKFIFFSLISGSKSERISFADKVAVFNVQHSGSTDELIEKIVGSSKTSGVKLEPTSVNDGVAKIEVKQ